MHRVLIIFLKSLRKTKDYCEKYCEFNEFMRDKFDYDLHEIKEEEQEDDEEDVKEESNMEIEQE